MKTILELSHVEVRQFFLKQESYCDISLLPKYFVFQSLLDALSTEIGNKDIKQIQCDESKKHDDINHTIFSNKDGKFAWRPLQLINPAIYVFLVHKITEEANWEFIVKRFKEFQTNTEIECCSIPVLHEEENKTDKESIITNWWNVIEQQSLELSLSFDYLLSTDITYCYGSIYTHVIPWSLHDKKTIKSNLLLPKNQRKKYLGDDIDMAIQAMQNAQTNGIPQGSTLMDFIAEMVLGYADLLLSDKIHEEDITNYKILRYRDDYRIFTNSQETALKITKLLTEVLIGLNLRLNSNKTFISNDIIQDAIKPDKIFWLGCKQKEKNLQKTLLLIHSLAKKYPNSGCVMTALSKFYNRIYEKQKFDKENIKVLISIIVDIAYKNPKTYPITMAILSKLLLQLDDNKEINEIVDCIKNRFDKIPNVGHLQIWLQRLTLKIYENENYDEKLCRKVINDDIVIWNIDWLNNNIKNIFYKNSIIDRDYIEKMEPIIKPSEVLLYFQKLMQYNAQF